MKFQQVFKNFLLVLEQKSTCCKAQIGALIVKENRTVSMGYNGSPAGSINCNQVENGEQICGKDSSGSCYLGIHAEQNAIAYAARQGISTDGASIYVSQSPCINCAKLITASGIKQVYYIHPYRLNEGIEFLKKHNINVEQII